MTDPERIRDAVKKATDEELQDLAAEIRGALEGDSNDAEHEALYAVASFLVIEYDPDDDE